MGPETAEGRRIRWGVIGAGGIARRRTIPEGIVPAKNAVLTAVYNPTQATNEAIGQEFGALVCRSVEELLALDIEAVYVASPPDVHREQVLACARAGKHVLCEKPLGVTVSDAEAIVDACHEAKVRLGTAFMMRFQAQHQVAYHLIRHGALGKSVFARAQLSCWYPPIPGAWRQDPARGGGGSLIDLGGHCIDLLEMLFGPVAAVSCFVGRTVHDYPTEDSAVVTLRFANGAHGVVDAFFCVPDQACENRLEVYGSLGSILARGTIGQESLGVMTARLCDDAGGYEAGQAYSLADGVAIAPLPVNMYRAEIEEFGRALIENREPFNKGTLGLRSQRLLAACYESARTGRVIEVPAGGR